MVRYAPGLLEVFDLRTIDPTEGVGLPIAEAPLTGALAGASLNATALDHDAPTGTVLLAGGAGDRRGGLSVYDVAMTPSLVADRAVSRGVLDAAFVGGRIAALERDPDTCELVVYERRADRLVATSTIAVPACRDIVFAEGDDVVLSTDGGVAFASVATATVTTTIELDQPATGATPHGRYFTVYDRTAAHNITRACLP